MLQGCSWHHFDCVYHTETAEQAAPQLEAGTLQGDWQQWKLLQHCPDFQILKKEHNQQKSKSFGKCEEVMIHLRT